VCEQISRPLRAWCVPKPDCRVRKFGMWHERDISPKFVERLFSRIPQFLSDYMLAKMTTVIGDIVFQELRKRIWMPHRVGFRDSRCRIWGKRHAKRRRIKAVQENAMAGGKSDSSSRKYRKRFTIAKNPRRLKPSNMRSDYAASSALKWTRFSLRVQRKKDQ